MNAKPKLNQTKVTVPPPPRTNRAQFLGFPDVVAEPAPQNLAEPSTTRLANLNLKVAESFHRAMKRAAADKGISMKEIVEESFKLWARANGVPDADSLDAGVVQQRAKSRTTPRGGSSSGGTPDPRAKPVRASGQGGAQSDLYRG